MPDSVGGVAEQEPVRRRPKPNRRGRTARTMPEVYAYMLSRSIARNGCIEWTGSRTFRGYGQVFFAGHEMRTHRLSWMHHNGPIAEGLFVCHRCDNPACFKIEHLFLGSHQDNMDDMLAKGRARREGWNGLKTHCKHGHEFTPDNIYDYGDGRICKQCAKARVARRKERLGLTAGGRVAAMEGKTK